MARETSNVNAMRRTASVQRMNSQMFWHPVWMVIGCRSQDIFTHNIRSVTRKLHIILVLDSCCVAMVLKWRAKWTNVLSWWHINYIGTDKIGVAVDFGNFLPRHTYFGKTYYCNSFQRDFRCTFVASNCNGRHI